MPSKLSEAQKRIKTLQRLDFLIIVDSCVDGVHAAYRKASESMRCLDMPGVNAFAASLDIPVEIMSRFADIVSALIILIMLVALEHVNGI